MRPAIRLVPSVFCLLAIMVLASEIGCTAYKRVLGAEPTAENVQRPTSNIEHRTNEGPCVARGCCCPADNCPCASRAATLERDRIARDRPETFAWRQYAVVLGTLLLLLLVLFAKRRARRAGLLLALVAISAAAGEAQAQCRGGQCTLPARPLVRIAAPRENGPRVNAQAAAVQVLFTTGRETREGSGAFVDANEQRAIVLTCAHTFLEDTGPVRRSTDRALAGQVTIRTAAGETLGGTLLGVDATWDVAAVETNLPRQTIALARLADAHPQPGETLYAAGYGGGQGFAYRAGRVTGYSSPYEDGRHACLLTLTGATRGGDSGGPILTTDGRLAAIITGSDGQTTRGPYHEVCRRFLDSLFGRRQLPATQQVGPQTTVPQLTTPALTGPPGPTATTDYATRADLAAVAARVTELERNKADAAAVGNAIEDAQQAAQQAEQTAATAVERAESTAVAAVEEQAESFGQVVEELRERVTTIREEQDTSIKEAVLTAVRDTAVDKVPTIAGLAVSALGMSTPIGGAIVAASWILRRRMRRRIARRDAAAAPEVAAPQPFRSAAQPHR